MLLLGCLSGHSSCLGGLSLRLDLRLVLGVLGGLVVRVLVMALRPLRRELLLVEKVLHLYAPVAAWCCG